MKNWTKELIEFASDLFCVVGFDGHFRALNPAWEQTLGYTPAELMERPFFELIHPDERELARRTLATLTNEGVPAAAFEYRCRHRNGAYRRLSWSVRIDAENRLVYGSARDVSALAQTVQRRTHELRQVNSKLEAILESSGDAIVLLDERGQLENTNAAFRSLFGSGWLTLREIVVESCRQQLGAALEQAIIHRERTRMPAQLECQDGTCCDAELTFSPVINNENHVVCTIHDVSHLKKVEQIKDQFISTVNHELRNPIAGIVLVADVLHKYYDQQTEAQRRRRISQIHKQAHALTDLVDAILDMARIGERRGKPAGSPVDVTRLVQEVVEGEQAKASTKNQTIAVHLPDKPVVALGEYTDFARIWRNLVDNAVKYSGEGGHIDVTLGISGASLSPQNPAFRSPPAIQALPPDRYFIGQVEDDGHGMKAEDLEQMFTRFFRGWAEQSNIPGTGLGLVLVRELLRLYEGGIHVDSQPGVGSLFTFWIPLEPSTSSPNKLRVKVDAAPERAGS